MKKNVFSKILMMASVVAVLSGFNSCKDYSDEVNSDLLAKLENQNTTLQEALAAQKEEFMQKIAELEAAQEACKSECANKMKELDAKWNTNLAAEIAKLQNVDASLQDQINKINALLGAVDPNKTIAEQIADVNKIAAEAAANAQSALEQLKTVNATTKDFEERITSLENWQKEVKDLIVAWSDRLTKVETDAAKALADAKANADRIEIIEKLAAAHGVRLDSIVEVLKDYATKEELAEVKTLAENNLAAAKEYADSQVAALTGGYTGTIKDLETEMLKADSLLAERLDAVENAVNEIKDQVAKNTVAIDNLTGAMKKLITSVIIQGTENPVMGSIATPFNTRSNILAAYYGSVESQGLEFPTELPRFYVDNVVLTTKDIEMLGVSSITAEAGSTLLGSEGNAGTLYLTVNPNTVDFTGTTFTLVNSQDELAGAELGSIELSDEVLSFGITRAKNNGFYETKATIKDENLEKVKLNLNFNEIKDVATDIFDGEGVNVTQLANTVANTMSSFNMEANGVKASWTDSDGEHSTYSQYGVAVVAVKPLSFTFGKDFNYQTVPGYERLEGFIGKITDKVKAAIAKTDKLLNIDLIEIKEIIIPETPEVEDVQVSVTIPGQWIDNGYGKQIWVDAKTTSIYVPIQEVVDDVYGDLASSFSDVNAMLDDLRGMMKQINDILKAGKDLQAEANSYADRFQTKLTDYLNKFNNKFCNIINSTNKALRPVLLVNTNKGFHKISQAENNPTVITGTELELIPTSYTMEYIAPAYKKLVGVTNVYKDGASAQTGNPACMAALNKVNAQNGIAEILAGNTYQVTATLETGFVYEIVYTAVDFYGKVDAKKFYVTVK